MSANSDLNMLRYWRNTLADSARVVIDVGKTLHQRQAKVELSAGVVAAAQTLSLLSAAEKRLNEDKGRLTNDHPGWEVLAEVRVLIAYVCRQSAFGAGFPKSPFY